MPKPEDVQAVQRFVNTVKYLSRFLEDLSDMSEPLRRLTHKDVPWEWSQEQEEAFAKIKKAVSTAPVLKFFTPSAPTEGGGDASEKGIGFALMQQGQPVTYASRTLTKAEQNYSQIEKELLAQSLKAVILNGWLNQRESLPAELHQYFNVRDELAA